MKLDETPGYALCRIARKVHYQIDLIFKEEGMTVEQWVALKTISENQSWGASSKRRRTR